MKRLLLIGLLLCMAEISLFASSPKYEMRGVWITTVWGLDWPSQPVRRVADVAKQQGEMIAILDELQALGINTVFFQVRTRGEVFYRSQYEPWAKVLSEGRNPNYDPLVFVIEECHKRAIECHAWIVTFPLGNDKQIKQLGDKSLVSCHRSWCKRLAGEWFLDPGNPEVEGYLIRLVGEIVTQYDIDGVHLDYVRYPDDAKRFPDADSFRKWGGASGSLAQWREDNVTRVVTAIYDKVKGLKPWVQVSSAPLGRYASLPDFPASWSCREAVSQNPKLWLSSGKHDFITPMMYYQGTNYDPFLYDWATTCPPWSVASGLGAYRLDKSEGGWELSVLQRQIELTRRWGVGQAYFRHDHLHRHTALRQWLSTWFYTSPALTPRRNIALSSLPQSPDSLQVCEEGGTVTLTWSSVAEAFTYILYATDETLDVSQGEQIVAVLPRSETSYTLPCTYRNYAVAVRDRYGRESHPAVYKQQQQEKRKEIYTIEYYINKHKK